MMGSKKQKGLEAWPGSQFQKMSLRTPQFQKMPLQTQEEGELEERIGRKVSQDSGVGDDIDGGECQEIADLFTEQKIAVDVTAMEARTQSSCSSLISGGDDSRTLELDIFTMCRSETIQSGQTKRAHPILTGYYPIMYGVLPRQCTWDL